MDHIFEFMKCDCNTQRNVAWYVLRVINMHIGSFRPQESKRQGKANLCVIKLTTSMSSPLSSVSP